MHTFLGIVIFVAIIAAVALAAVFAASKSKPAVVLHRGPVLRASKDGVEILEDK